MSGKSTNIAVSLENNGSLKTPCVTHLCVFEQNSSPSLCVIYEKCRHSSSLVWGPSQPQSFTVVVIWSLIQAVWIWEKHNAINGFPEKISECIIHTHLFKCTHGWLLPVLALIIACQRSSLFKTYSLWLTSYTHRTVISIRRIIVYNIMKAQVFLSLSVALIQFILLRGLKFLWCYYWVLASFLNGLPL